MLVPYAFLCICISFHFAWSHIVLESYPPVPLLPSPPINFYNVSNDFVAIHSISTSQEEKEMEFVSNSLDDEYPIVKISDGFLKGFTMKTITNRSIAAFKSVPFAQPPIGPLRFKPPVKNSPWSGVRDAMADSPTCIQADYIQQYKIHGTEDCLYLSIYVPKNPKTKGPLPVMIWIHGGGWFFSSSSLYGPAYLLDQDVILVAGNYRLSMFGFLATGDLASPGNYGLKDQAMVLSWTKANIAALNGDPNRVTLFGESAGAGSTHFHMFSPLSRGLFHGGISQSGCATCFWSISEKAPENTIKYASLLNCTGSSEEIVECLRTKDAYQMVAMQLAFLEWTMYPVVIFGPVLEPEHEGAFLSELPIDIYKREGVADVPWISGFNSDEGAINIAVLHLGNGSVSQLNNDWKTYGQIFLDFKDTEENPEEISEKVRNHYFGNNSIQYENKDVTIKMFGDRYVYACGVRGIQLHAHYSSKPVYAYQLSYKGKYSIVQLLGQKAQDYGVSHLDDLIYLFNNTAYYPTISVDDDEYQVSKIVTKLWATFAATGQPHLPAAETNNKINDNYWRPVEKDMTLDSKVEFFDITLPSPKMIPDPYYERVKFWKSLNLRNQ